MTRYVDWLFELPFVVVMLLVLLLVVIGALAAAWTIYLVGQLNIPFHRLCDLWPPGWKCP